LKILGDHKQELVKRYSIRSLAVFGSVARDQAGPGSDVDLLVEFTETPGLFDFIGLQQELESLLGCEVDLGTPRSLKPGVQPSALREAIYVA
jgi:hypothetical protein